MVSPLKLAGIWKGWHYLSPRRLSGSVFSPAPQHGPKSCRRKRRGVWL